MRGTSENTIAILQQRVAELEASVAQGREEISDMRRRQAKVQERLHARTIKLWGQLDDYKNYLGQALRRAERAEAELRAIEKD